MPDRTQEEIQELREEIRRLREERSGNGSDGNGPKGPQPETEKEDVRPPAEKPQPEAPKPPMGQRVASGIRNHPVGALIGLLLLAAAIIGGFFLWQYLSSFESTDDARIDGHVNAITPRVSGTITSVRVVENQKVKKGDLLIELDPRDYAVGLERAQANFSQAQASTQAQQTNVPITSTSTATTIDTARSEVLNAQAGLSAAEREREVQVARLAEARANEANAQADLARYRMLVAKDEVSREEFDERVAKAAAATATVQAQQAAVSAAQKTIDQRNAAVDQAKSRLNQAIRNAPHEVNAQRATVEVQRAAANAARAAVNEAELNLQYTKLYAPVDGVVGRRAAEVGQRVQPGQQLLSIVQNGEVWVTANFKENQLRHMRAGQSARIHVDAFDRDYDGYVESMPAASAATFSMLPPENASGNYVKVVQRLPVRLRFKQGADPDRLLRPGMSAEPKVWIK